MKKVIYKSVIVQYEILLELNAFTYKNVHYAVICNKIHSFGNIAIKNTRINSALNSYKIPLAVFNVYVNCTNARIRTCRNAICEYMRTKVSVDISRFSNGRLQMPSWLLHQDISTVILK